MRQMGLEVTPTRTIATFRTAKVDVRLTFTSPLLPHDLDVMTRPATYVTWDITSRDGKTHDVQLYLGASALLSVNDRSQAVDGGSVRVRGLSAVKIGSKDQPVLGRSGDDLRIEWGHLLLAAPSVEGKTMVSPGGVARYSFRESGVLPTQWEVGPTEPGPHELELAAIVSAGKVGTRTVSRHAVVAYDDEFSIQYFGQNLRPWWRRKGAGTTELLIMAERDYASVLRRCEAFDRELTADMTRLGGRDYAYLGALAHRQALAAQKVVADENGQPLMFSKENFSNGCIGTVDVLYPAAPQLLLFSPTLTKASLVPILEYAASERWKFPFAPHDLGQYPLANGQEYGGGERSEENQMPVEESGNMLILLAALAQMEGNADFAGNYWPTISKWAAYLAEEGFDPESQLSTDDFAGHLAHNVNLSAKAIEALGAYAKLAEMRGLKDEALKYRTMASSFAQRWMQEAKDGDHYRLAFDKPGTWSQKYNLVWDRMLGLNLFPANVARTELDFYRKVSNRYGLPLDSRRDYSKLDWIVWTATLTGERSDFDALIAPVVKFLDATPQRVPMTDWFRTVVPDKEGFQARSVVGGVFIKMLDDPATWKKYAARDRMKVGGWAPVPKPPIVTPVVPTSEVSPIEWSYTTDRPGAHWFAPSFDASAWKRGPAGFGTRETPSTVVRTVWNTPDIWIRREFNLDKLGDDLRLYIHHDENVEVYINGVLAGRFGGYTTRYEVRRLNEAGKRALRVGRNVIAIHCHQTGGGQYIDAGLATVTRQK
jgi:hypothetical protein